MLYSIVGQDVENSLKARLAARPDHVERLKQLVSQGRLILAGPNPAIDSSDPGDAGFNDKYDGADNQESLEDLYKDLSAVGEAMALRIESEDELLNELDA